MKKVALISAAILALIFEVAESKPLHRNHSVPQPITIDSAQVGCFTDAPSLQITLSNATWGYWGANSLYFFSPTSATSGTPFLGPTQIFNVSSGNYVISSSSTNASGAVTSQSASFTMPTCTRVHTGMTWIHVISNSQTGTITVGCGSTGPNPCNPNHGDTVCTQAMPVLCMYKPPTPFPLPAGVSSSDQYNKWSGGVVATTAPIPGTSLHPLNSSQPTAQADAICVANFGTGWRWAEFHDGWGWNFQAYGGTVSAPNVPSSRFWVYINDKPANC